MKIIKEFINRIKTLYLFWRLTKDIGHHWVVETGYNPDGKKWLELWTQDEYLIINKPKLKDK